MTWAKKRGRIRKPAPEVSNFRRTESGRLNKSDSERVDWKVNWGVKRTEVPREVWAIHGKDYGNMRELRERI